MISAEKKKSKKYTKPEMRIKIIISVICIIAIFLISFFITKHVIESLISEINSLKNSNEELKYELSELKTDYDEMSCLYEDALLQINTLKKGYYNICTEYADLQETVGFTKKSLYEIANKYRYIIDEAPSESDLSLGNLIELDNLAKKYDINPHIVTTIFKVESGYNNNAKNPKSTATGIGQFLKSSGEFTYTKILKIGNDYNHNVHAKDPSIGINMTFSYLNYLIDTYDCDIWYAIRCYSGGSDSYVNYVKRLTKNKLGVSDIYTKYQ